MILVVNDANHVACNVTYVSHEGGNLLLSGAITYFLLPNKQYQERTKSLEESIEAERAAHLETKFNSEIVQVSVHFLTRTKNGREGRGKER